MEVKVGGAFAVGGLPSPPPLSPPPQEASSRGMKARGTTKHIRMASSLSRSSPPLALTCHSPKGSARVAILPHVAEAIRRFLLPFRNRDRKSGVVGKRVSV